MKTKINENKRKKRKTKGVPAGRRPILGRRPNGVKWLKLIKTKINEKTKNERPPGRPEAGFQPKRPDFGHFYV